MMTATAEKPRHRVKASKAEVPAGAAPRPSAGYMRDSQSGIIASRPASLMEHRAEVRRVWWRAAALAMDMLQNSGRLRGAADQIIADSVGVELQLNPRPDLSAFGYDRVEATDWVRMVKGRFKIWAWNPLECDYRAKFTIPQLTDIGMRNWMGYGESSSRPAKPNQTSKHKWTSTMPQQPRTKLRTLTMAGAGLMLILAGGCVTDQEKYSAAIATQAVAAAPTNLPEWPVQCDEPMPTVIPKDGEKFRFVQDRWEIVRDNENKTKAWCSRFYADAKLNAAGTQK